MVRREAVTLADDEVIEFLVGEHDIAQDLVLHSDRLRGHLEAQDVLLACRKPDSSLSWIVICALTVDEGLLFRLGFLAHLGEFFGGLEARVREAQIDELPEGFVVEGESLGLVVRPDAARVAATGVEGGSVIPGDPEPCEVFENAPCGGFGGSFLVGVLDAQNEAARVPVRISRAEQSGSGTPDMQVSGRRGSESGDWVGHRGRIGVEMVC